MIVVGKISAILVKPQCVFRRQGIISNGFCKMNIFGILMFYYSDVTMSATASQITSISTLCSAVCSGAHQRKPSKLRVTGLYEGNQSVTGGFPPQRANNAENISIWWRHHHVIFRWRDSLGSNSQHLFRQWFDAVNIRHAQSLESMRRIHTPTGISELIHTQTSEFFEKPKSLKRYYSRLYKNTRNNNMFRVV